jgi:AraC-like DNA-binding protein
MVVPVLPSWSSLNLFKTGLQITQIAEQIGFSSISYFAKCFNAEYGMPPKQYQKEQVKG